MLKQENYETILIEKRERIAVLTLNRPERLNAVNGSMHSELSTIFLDLQADGDVLAAVITGAGRGFCAGGDFSGASMATRSGLTLMQEGRRIVDSILYLEKTLLSAVNGAARGE